MTELDKLERYLKNNNINYTRIDDGGVKMDTSIGEVTVGERHQIIVDDWDVICQPNSYGYKDGLLELAGSLVKSEFDGDVEGWITADEIISRLNKIPSKEIINMKKERAQMIRTEYIEEISDYERPLYNIEFETDDYDLYRKVKAEIESIVNEQKGK